jgi:hypothetical protein
MTAAGAGAGLRGAGRFAAVGLLSRPAAARHCRRCCKTSRHVVAATLAARDGLRFETGAGLRQNAGCDTGRRGFCATCGTSLFWHEAGGALDGCAGLRLAGHIFRADKGDCREPFDGAPRHAGDHRERTAP